MQTRLVFGTLALLAAIGCDFPKPKPKPPAEKVEEKLDDRNTNFRPGASVLKNSVQAGKRVAQMHDFDQMKFFIFAYELENNRMPTIDEIKADLKNYPDAREILKKIDEGVIILTGTKDKNGLWAYEVDADKAGGIICLGNSVSRASADDVKKYLGQK
jgi:hypothetical protein